jgi:hypothetical protein
MTYTYDPANLNVTPVTLTVLKDQVRFLVGDTKIGAKQLEDEEIIFTIGQRASTYGAAALCCKNLAAHLSREADSAQGPLHTALSQKSRNYAAMAARFENMATVIPGYAGGISVADKAQQELDPDRVPPNFNIGMTDNFLPEGPAGNEEPDAFSDESQNE